MTTQQSNDLYDKLVDAGALNPRYAVEVLERTAGYRSHVVPDLNKEDVKFIAQRLSVEDPAAVPVLEKAYLTELRKWRSKTKELEKCLDEIDDTLLPEEKNSVARAFQKDESRFIATKELYRGYITGFYQQPTLFDFLDTCDLGPKFRRPEGIGYFLHTARDIPGTTSNSYHFPALQALVYTLTEGKDRTIFWAWLFQYGSEENAQKVIDAIQEGNREIGK